MRSSLIASVSFHALVLAIGMLSLQGAEALNPPEIQAIPIELIPIDEFSNARLGSLESQVIETQAPSAVETDIAPELAEPTGNTEQDQPRPEATDVPTPSPSIETAPAPQPEPEPEPVPEPQPAPEPAPPPPPVPEPIPEPTPEPQPAPPVEDQVLSAPEPAPEAIAPVPPPSDQRVEAARQRFAEAQAAERARQEAERQAREEAERQRLAEQQRTQEADQVSDIINNEQSRGATTGSGGAQTAGLTSGTAALLTQSEKDALAAQMRKCWNPPISALEVEGLTVRLLVTLNIDGSVNGNPEILSPPTTDIERATGLAAQRAVRACGPYQLAREKFEDWRQVDVTFDPRDLS
jgi:outer membrane biosynthesis protein TonB